MPILTAGPTIIKPSLSVMNEPDCFLLHAFLEMISEQPVARGDSVIQNINTLNILCFKKSLVARRQITRTSAARG
jgi:hypothetical protein